MPLVDDMHNTYWSVRGYQWEIGLTDGGDELDAPGYSRQTVNPENWRIDGLAASTRVEFGPFPEGARATGAFLARGGTILERQQFTGTLEVLPRMGYVLTFAASIEA